MQDTQEKLQRIKSKFSEYDVRDMQLANFTPDQELRFHNYIKGVAQRLLGDTLNLDDKDIMFALTDIDVENAWCRHIDSDTNVIAISPKLLELCENEDQMAFILGHELGHYEERLEHGANKINSKAEETACDVRAIKKMARGGYNLEEACTIGRKIFDESHIYIGSLVDPHNNNNTRVNIIDTAKIAEEKRVIEEQNKIVTKITPIPEEIRKMVRGRSKKLSMAEELRQELENINDVDLAVKGWINAFHKSIIRSETGWLDITGAEKYELVAAIMICLRRFEGGGVP